MLKEYLHEVKEIADLIDQEALLRIAGNLQRSQRVLVLGVGGSAANASHAVCDLRKLCGIEAYTFENLAELTARTNDEGWENSYMGWLETMKAGTGDTILVLSVGGGDPRASGNLITALEYAKKVDCTILGIVGRDGGYTKKVADVCLVIPTVNPDRVTPHTEEYQSIILHLLTWMLKNKDGRWESLASFPVPST